MTIKIEILKHKGKIKFSKGDGTFTINLGKPKKPNMSNQSSLKEWFKKQK
jgi:hypothetical protein